MWPVLGMCAQAVVTDWVCTYPKHTTDNECVERKITPLGVITGASRPRGSPRLMSVYCVFDNGCLSIYCIHSRDCTDSFVHCEHTQYMLCVNTQNTMLYVAHWRVYHWILTLLIISTPWCTCYNECVMSVCHSGGAWTYCVHSCICKRAYDSVTHSCKIRNVIACLCVHVYNSSGATKWDAVWRWLRQRSLE